MFCKAHAGSGLTTSSVRAMASASRGGFGRDEGVAVAVAADPAAEADELGEIGEAGYPGRERARGRDVRARGRIGGEGGCRGEADEASLVSAELRPESTGVSGLGAYSAVERRGDGSS